ncbi:MAG: NAD-dependent epimerase/dehydratase family protein [Solobacterium sp.]|nr:NAD-dependent epimerase/dehydratase family protein [Solobacterium sp.]
MRVLVLGCGYLGHNLSRLMEGRFEISVLSIPSPYTDRTDHYREVNVFDPEQLKKVDLEDAVVVDSTGLVPNNATSNDEDAMLQDLLEKYRNLLKVLKEGGASRFVYISSGGTIYGSGNRAFEETDEIHPVSLYARSKAMTEQLIRDFGMDYLIVRLANPFGGYQEPNKRQGVIPILVRKALLGEVFEMWTDGSSIRDYIYITDAAEAMALLIEKGISNTIVNIGSGIGTSLKDVISEVEVNTGRKIRMEYQKFEVPVVESTLLNIDKLKQLTGFEPEVSFHEGVRLEVERVKEEIA